MDLKNQNRGPFFFSESSVQGNYNTPLEHTPTNPPTIPLQPVGKSCSGCVPKVCGNNLRLRYQTGVLLPEWSKEAAMKLAELVSAERAPNQGSDTRHEKRRIFRCQKIKFTSQKTLCFFLFSSGEQENGRFVFLQFVVF